MLKYLFNTRELIIAIGTTKCVFGVGSKFGRPSVGKSHFECQFQIFWVCCNFLTFLIGRLWLFVFIVIFRFILLWRVFDQFEGKFCLLLLTFLNLRYGYSYIFFTDVCLLAILICVMNSISYIVFIRCDFQNGCIVPFVFWFIINLHGVLFLEGCNLWQHLSPFLFVAITFSLFPIKRGFVGSRVIVKCIHTGTRITSMNDIEEGFMRCVIFLVILLV
mmetsp:Transcript_21284/g.29848  ORF Transcript_21284/g.29848 Transcript_21284/m.29848 type:complete len:218 (-) Transcript_21284:325-978(-)